MGGQWDVRPRKTRDPWAIVLPAHSMRKKIGEKCENSSAIALDDLDVLTTLINAYEEQHYPIVAPDPVEALRYWMETRDLTRRDLEPLLGSRARVAEILNRRRTLTLEMIRRLHTALGIPAEILIQPYSTSKAAA